MSQIDGTWDSIAKSPMGDQKSVMVLHTDGTALSGSSDTMMGKVEFDGGTVDGDRLAWTIRMTVPMPITIDVEATVSGDTMTGSMKMGVFGTFPMSATRRA